MVASVGEGCNEVTYARGYFVAQAIAGALWWCSVFAFDDVRRWTLGNWSAGVLVGPDLAFFVVVALVAGLRASRGAAVLSTVWTVGVTVVLAVNSLRGGGAGWGVVAMVVASAGSIAAASTLWFGRLPREVFFTGPFAFKVADERPGRSQLLRSLRQVVVFWTSFLVVLPLFLRWAEGRLGLTAPALQSTACTWAGRVLVLVGSILGLWSCVWMSLRGEGTPLPAATARKLVIGGPYRYVRNPMAVAGVIQTIGVGLWIGAWSVVVSAFVGAALWNVVIRPGEEADLAARFGTEYVNYRDRVRCWIPVRRQSGGRHLRPEG